MPGLTTSLGLKKPAQNEMADIDVINSNWDAIDALIPLSNMARQAIINGNFDVWQRGVSFTNPTSGAYTADRYRVSATPSGGTLPSTISHSRQQSVPGEVSGGN
ncbi:hypothetical protein [Paenibacillus elgii]|uniref:hypothetical protein n=1 Tax=Paenibacillus elgii TaxID=189691 RepID=UPI000248D999|nr:hypothetical protein [Paenibacillus elgii]